jgi:hypothetical protein
MIQSLLATLMFRSPFRLMGLGLFRTAGLFRAAFRFVVSCAVRLKVSFRAAFRFVSCPFFSLLVLVSSALQTATRMRMPPLLSRAGNHAQGVKIPAWKGVDSDSAPH